MANPLAHSWLKPNIQQNPSSESRGPINLLTNSRSSHDIPDVITGHLSRNDKEKKLKGNGNVETTGGCLPKSISSNSKVQSTTGSGDPPQPTRRQVNSILLITTSLHRKTEKVDTIGQFLSVIMLYIQNVAQEFNSYIDIKICWFCIPCVISLWSN